MAENNSIDNLDRQDLLTVLDGFIKQTEQINEIKDEYNSRYRDVAYKLLLTKKYKEPKNLVIAYFLAPFYLLKGKKLKQETYFGWLYRMVGLLFGLSGYLQLFLAIQELVTGGSDSFIHLQGFIVGETIGYFMGRKKYKQYWLEKVIKKGNYDDEIDAAVDSDQQIIDIKDLLNIVVSDATYQQYRSLIPQNFTLDDIMGIYQMLLDYRADNFKEAVNAWRQEQHNKQVENKMNENNRKISQMEANITNLAMRAKQQDEAKAKSDPMLSNPITAAIKKQWDYEEEREKKEAAKRADKANELIIKKLKD